MIDGHGFPLLPIRVLAEAARTARLGQKHPHLDRKASLQIHSF